MSIVLISYTRWPDDKGGVPLYNHYLQRIFPDSKWYCWQDFGAPSPMENISELSKARILNRWLEQRGKISKGDIIVGDGVWGNYGLSPKKYTLVSVCHGLWRCSHGVCEIAKIQQKGYVDSKLVVACSPSAKREAEIYYDVSSTVVYTGVDLDFWSPPYPSSSQRDIILWVKKWKEFPSLNQDCIKVLSGFKHKVIDTYEDEKVRNLYRRAKVFVHLTTNEGNAFAILKALACDTPVVSSPTGLFNPCPSLCGVVAEPKVGNVVEAIHKVVERTLCFSPRVWMGAHASLFIFGEKWRSLLGKL